MILPIVQIVYMILNDHLSAGDGGARTAGSPRLIPRWPSLSSSSNTCAPESTPSADSIGDGTGESPCGDPSESPCGGGGVSLGSVPSESQGRAEGVEDTKGRRRCSLSSTNSRNPQHRRNPRAGRTGGGRGAWYEGVYLHNTLLSGIIAGGYV
jgi:hypothetical protein